MNKVIEICVRKSFEMKEDFQMNFGETTYVINWCDDNIGVSDTRMDGKVLLHDDIRNEVFEIPNNRDTEKIIENLLKNLNRKHESYGKILGLKGFDEYFGRTVYYPIKIETRVTLDELYQSDAICLLGLNKGCHMEFIDWMESECDVRFKPTMKVFEVSGEMMNRSYGLTGDNAYSNDLNIVLISLNDVEDIGKLPMRRFEMEGLKWFCDVVDNNEVQERDSRFRSE